MRILRWVALVCTGILAPVLHAQSTEADIKARLTGKGLYLRGFWHDDRLRFSPEGQLIGTSSPTSFTVCGFDSKSVRLKPDKLIIDGQRVGLELANDKPTRVALPITVHLEIAASPTGDYGPALDAIFVDGLANLAPLLPSYWQRYARQAFLGVTSPPVKPSEPPSDPTLSRIGGAVTAPKLLRSAEPQFSTAARALKYSGNVLVNCWVGTDGRVSHLAVLRAVGLGLDEQALAAVQQYSFQPAMRDGKPVLVELNVEVNFKIF